MKKKSGQDKTIGDFLAGTTDKLGRKLNEMELSYRGSIGEGSHLYDRKDEITLNKMINEELGDFIDIDDTLPDELKRQ